MPNSGNSFIVTLQENVPLSEADAALTAEWVKDEKVTNVAFKWIALSILIVLAGVIKLTNIPVNVLYGALILVLACFGPWLMEGFFVNKKNHCYEQVISNGKSILTSTLVGKGYNGYRAYYLFFAGLPNSKPIRISVSSIDYKRYSEGTRLRVSFLPSRKVALHITEAEQA